MRGETALAQSNSEDQFNILVVDQYPASQHLIESYLKALNNARVFYESDPLKALESCEKKCPDLVLLDESFDHMSALDFIKHFKTKTDCDVVPILVLSTHYSQESKKDYIEGGANDLLTKPIDVFELQTHVRNLLSLRKTQKRLEHNTISMRDEIDKATENLKRSEERYVLAAKGANDGLWDWDLLNKKIYYSPRWKEMLGYEESELSDSVDEWISRIHPDDLDQFQLDMDAYLTGLSDHFENEHRIRHRKGYYQWALCRGLAVKEKDNKPTRFVGSFTDITERKKAEQRLLHGAFHDTLTGLPNRALFMDRLNQALAGRNRFTVLFMDMDRFKNVNDTLGHKAGDELLVVLARRLEKCCRASDTVARLGGDEFTILLPEVSTEEEAEMFASRLLAEASSPITIAGQEIFPNLSIGIAIGDQSLYRKAEEIIRDADIAMYRAKENGKGRFEIFDEDMRSQTVSMFKLETNLRRAIERGEIILYYQPIVNLRTGRVAGCEALMRWDHPEHGIVSPVEFVPLAEETKMIVPLGNWALSSACNQLTTWHKRFEDRDPYFVTVNVSGKQLEHQGFMADVMPILNRSAVNTSCVKLEITESMIMDDPDRAERLMHELKGLGLKLAIDDFGTGYSSLSYLHRFPFDTLKIDRSFVVKMVEDDKFLETVRIIIMLAQSLGMDVVAEGIEKEEELKLLRQLKCTYGQGYLFSRPVPVDEMSVLLADNPKW